MTSAREVWTEARRRLVERYMAENPAVSRSEAFNRVSARHEEIGAIMDAIEGKSR